MDHFNYQCSSEPLCQILSYISVTAGHPWIWTWTWKWRWTANDAKQTYLAAIYTCMYAVYAHAYFFLGRKFRAWLARQGMDAKGYEGIEEENGEVE